MPRCLSLLYYSLRFELSVTPECESESAFRSLNLQGTEHPLLPTQICARKLMCTNDLLHRHFVHSLVDQSPAGWKLASVKRSLYWIVFLHVVETIRKGVEPAVYDTLFVTGLLFFIGMVSTNSIDVAGEGAKPTTKKGSRPRCH